MSSKVWNYVSYVCMQACMNVCVCACVYVLKWDMQEGYSYKVDRLNHTKPYDKIVTIFSIFRVVLLLWMMVGRCKMQLFRPQIYIHCNIYLWEYLSPTYMYCLKYCLFIYSHFFPVDLWPVLAGRRWPSIWSAGSKTGRSWAKKVLCGKNFRSCIKWKGIFC